MFFIFFDSFSLYYSIPVLVAWVWYSKTHAAADPLENFATIFFLIALPPVALALWQSWRIYSYYKIDGYAVFLVGLVFSNIAVLKLKADIRKRAALRIDSDN